MTGQAFVATLALLAVLAVGVAVLVTELDARRPHGRHRVDRVDETTVPLTVGRWS
jgi:hypothetical protein